MELNINVIFHIHNSINYVINHFISFDKIGLIICFKLIQIKN